MGKNIYIYMFVTIFIHFKHNYLLFTLKDKETFLKDGNNST